MIKKVVITIGCPAGCGPYVTLAAVHALKKEKLEFFVVGDIRILERFSIYKKIKQRINLFDLATEGIEKIKPGEAIELSGKASLDYLNKALRVLKEVKSDRLVTAPLSKEAVKIRLKNFSGHTEYLADYFGVDNFAMMMVSPNLKTILFSRHILLRQASAVINEEDFLKTISLVIFSLKDKFKIKNPKVAVASFNPHAGVDTFLDREEKDMRAAVKRAGAGVCGPYPCDTLFTPDKLKKFDCVLCPYHDQAMIPFKLLSFKRGVNLTLGLPIIRTSPAHGTAYDLTRAGKKPFFTSMAEAIKLAARLKI